MVEKRDYYETLGVGRGAGLDEIKKAYKRLARKHHPDVNPGDHEAEARFKEINEAYQILSDEEKRDRYNRYGHEGVSENFPGDFSGFGVDLGGIGDIFDMFFGGRTQRPGRPSAERGNDLRYDIEMTLEEAAHGVERVIQVSRMEVCETCKGSGASPGTFHENCGLCGGSGQVRQQQQSFFGTQVRITTCPRCHGEGRVITSPCAQCSGQGRLRKTLERAVNIPAGVDTGMRIRLGGEGDAGLRGGPSGDLYLITHVRRHSIFERRGNDLWCEIPVGFPTAALGGSVEVPTIDESEMLALSPGTQSGEVYALRGKGMPDPSGRGRGDLNVVVKVVTPTKLNAEQKELLRRFAETSGEEIRQCQEKNFFERVKDALNGM